MAVTTSYLETPPLVALAANQINVLVASSITGVTNLCIRLEILKYVNSVLTGTGFEDSLTVINGVANFDISAYFAGMLTPKFTFPDHFTNIVIPQSEMVVKYRVKTWETYTDASGVHVDKKVADSLENGSDLYVVAGGISEDENATLNTLSSCWWDEWIGQKRFQHCLPGAKTTSLKSIEKLFWIARRTAAEVISIAWTATDGTTGTNTVPATMTIYTLYEICVSPAIAESITGKELTSYTICITDQSETVTYEIDHDDYENEEFFLFANQFNCYESLWCRASREGTIAFNRVQFEQPLRKNFTHTDRRFGATRAIITRTRKSNTGYLGDITWYNWALALFAGDDAWTYSANSLSPIVLLTDESTYVDDLQDIWNLEFTWKHGREGRFGAGLGLVIEYVLPPYYSKLAAFFYKIERGSLIDAIAGLTAPVDTINITWPNIPASDVLDFSDAAFWNNTGLGFYSAIYPRHCPLGFMVGGVWAEPATASTHARLFHRDYSSRLRDMLPVLVYNQNLTAGEQTVVVAWLDWYQVLTQDGAILKQGNDTLIQ
jgi:hypothetical protein